MSSLFCQAPLVLASASASRERLLHSLQLDFICQAANIDEDAIKQQDTTGNFAALAQQLACEKALAISHQHPDAYVIGADQLCVCDTTIFDKPMQHSRAIEHLLLLQGKEHQQLCAMSIAHQGRILWKYVDVARLWMRPLNQAVIESYVGKEKPYYSCGAYHFEGPAKALFTRVEGSESSIQGLALVPLIEGLIQSSVISLKDS